MNKDIKVVAINSPYQIVLNAGKDDGVNINNKFIVYGVGQMIVDPDTKDDLEKLEIPRGRGKVIHVQNKICTLESIEVSEIPTTIKRTNRLGSAFIFSPNLNEESETRRDKLPFKDVQVGDFARKY